jgi:hypothetical protein
MQDWLHRLGYAFEWMRDEVQGAARFAAEAAEPANLRETISELAEEVREAPGDGDIRGLAGGALPLAATAVGGWLASRLLRPGEVRVARAVVAGVAGTLAHDVVARIGARAAGREYSAARPLGAAITDREELQDVAGWAAHYAAGIGLAIVYGRYLHGRIPAPGAVQGALFGAADAVTVRWGGVLPLLGRLLPDAALPGGYASLADDDGLSAQSLARHVAFGAVVGAIYDRD